VLCTCACQHLHSWLNPAAVLHDPAVHQVGKVMFDFDFYDESGKKRVDIKQVLVVQQCGTTKLPVTLAQGQDLEW
jgi:hypothetical protein